MARKTKEKDPIPTTEIMVAPRKELVLEGDPMVQLEFAQKAAKALMSVVDQKKKKVVIGGKTYIEYGDWQTLARFFGSTVGVDWTKPYEEGGKKIGWEARAIVYRDGMVISSAEAMCTIHDKNWGNRDDFQRRSMAQTRACAKALRNAFGWVAELAGYSSTPAEEMDGLYDQSPVAANAVPTVTYDDHEDAPATPKPHNTGQLAQPIGESLKPWQVKPKVVTTDLQLKKKIKDLADKIVMVPLEGGEYKEWIESNTGLELNASNYQAIIERLTALQ